MSRQENYPGLRVFGSTKGIGYPKSTASEFKKSNMKKLKISQINAAAISRDLKFIMTAHGSILYNNFILFITHRNHAILNSR